MRMTLFGIAAAVGASVAVGGIVVTISTAGTPLWGPLLVTGGLCLCIALWSAQHDRDWLAPFAIVGAVLFLFYVLRPVYILATGHWGPTRALDDEAVTPDTVKSMVAASWIAALGVAAIACGYALHASARLHALSDWKAIRARLRGSVSLRLGGVRLLILGSGLLAGWVYLRLIRQAGGLNAYVNALSVRSGLFAGRAYLVVAALPLKVAALALLAAVLSRGRLTRSNVLILAVLLVGVGVGDFLTGGRAGLLLGTLLPATLLFHYLYRPLRLPVLAGLLAIALVVFVGVRVVTRDAVYDGHQETRTQLFIQTMNHLPSTTVGGREVIEFDSLMRLVQASDSGAAWQDGDTYAATLAFPVPRFLWPGKPSGGNAWFTSTYYPGYYSIGQTQTSISLVGEAYANFGEVGVAAVGLLFGLILSVLYRRLLRARGVRTVLEYSILLGYALTILRGDAYHSLSSAALSIVLVRMCWPWLEGHAHEREYAERVAEIRTQAAR